MIDRKSIPDQIRETILRRIATGQLQPGDRVVETRLAQELNVSPIPVREAIRELVAIGVLESAPHKGAWVREVSLEETIEAFQVRSSLDRLAVCLAGKRLQKCIPRLRQAVTQLIDAAKRNDSVAFQDHNQVFHRTIVEAAGNSVLLRVWDSLAFEVRTRFTMELLTSVDPVPVAQEHEGILAAIERGEIEQAANLLARHSDHVVEHLRQELTRPADDLSEEHEVAERSGSTTPSSGDQ